MFDALKERMVRSPTAFYVGSALAGLVRVTIGFPIEHPIDSIKTQWQAKPYIKNEYQIIKVIYQDKGIVKGLYAGGLPNFFRCLLKNTYRYPLMVGLPNFYKTKLPSSISERVSLLKFLTGGSIALVETTLLTPVERVKTHFMTKNNSQSYV